MREETTSRNGDAMESTRLIGGMKFSQNEFFSSLSRSIKCIEQDYLQK
jgi:hypothetical protein